MKTQVLFQALLSVCLLIATTCYGQTGYKLRDLEVKKTGYDLQGTLRVSQSYDKQTKMLTLKMKNEYKHDIIIFQSSITFHLFVCEYAAQRKFPTNRNAISKTGRNDVTVSNMKIIKPDSTHIIPYNCEYMITEGFDQVSFEGAIPYFLVDEKEEVIATGSVLLEEQRFDLY